MPKKKKGKPFRREVPNKKIKKLAKLAAHSHRKDAGRMMAIAVIDEDKYIYACSGPAGVSSPNNPYPGYLLEYASKLPWNGKTPALTRRFDLCAEAHLWTELMGRGHDPRWITIVSFNKEGVVAAPCDNCQKWVHDAFATVYTESPSYNNRTRQKPNR